MRTIRDVTLVVLTLLGAIGFSQVPRFVRLPALLAPAIGRHRTGDAPPSPSAT